MRRGRWLLLAVTLLTVGSLAMGTSGFSAATVDRGVSVDVANDHEEAIVPLADPGEAGSHPAPDWVDDPSQLNEEPVRSDGQRVRLFLVHNRFETRIDVGAEPIWGEFAEVSAVESVTLGPGETAAVSGTVECGEYAGRTMTELNVTATTKGTTAHITYRIQLVCAKKTPTPEQTDGEGESGESSA